jgi:hypothetical protein
MARSAKLASLMAALALGGSGSVLSDDLAKASQNPVGDIISLPIELWHYGDMPGDSDATLLIAKPVYPVNIGKVNLVNRLIVPYVWVDANLSQLDLGDFEVPPEDVNRNGFANIQYQGFLTPAKPGKVIWGLGPVLEMPTNTNDLGTDKWSAGPAAVVLTMPGNWVIGALAQNLWSFAGSDSAKDVNKLTFQYFRSKRQAGPRRGQGGIVLYARTIAATGRVGVIRRDPRPSPGPGEGSGSEGNTSICLSGAPEQPPAILRALHRASTPAPKYRHHQSSSRVPRQGTVRREGLFPFQGRQRRMGALEGLPSGEPPTGHPRRCARLN